MAFCVLINKSKHTGKRWFSVGSIPHFYIIFGVLLPLPYHPTLFNHTSPSTPISASTLNGSKPLNLFELDIHWWKSNLAVLFWLHSNCWVTEDWEAARFVGAGPECGSDKSGSCSDNGSGVCLKWRDSSLIVLLGHSWENHRNKPRN